MSKKAYLVAIDLLTRVIADESATQDEIAEAAIEKVKQTMIEDGIGTYICLDNVGEIIDDDECPYGTFQEDNQ